MNWGRSNVYYTTRIVEEVTSTDNVYSIGNKTREPPTIL